MLDLRISLINESISSSLFSEPVVLSSISCILFVMLASAVPDYLPRFSISKIQSFCVFYIVTIIFQVLSVLVFSFISLFGFSWLTLLSLRDLLLFPVCVFLNFFPFLFFPLIFLRLRL